MPPEAAALIVAGIWLVVAAVLAVIGPEGPRGDQSRAAGDAALDSRRLLDGPVNRRVDSEIAGTRQALSSDLDALQDKVSPSAIIERRKAATRSRLAGVRNSVMGSTSKCHVLGRQTPLTVPSSRPSRGVEGSPLAAGLVAFGAGLLVAALVPASGRRVSGEPELVDTAKEHGQPVVDQAKAAGQDLAEGLTGPAQRRRPRRSGTPPSSRPSASRTRASPPPSRSGRTRPDTARLNSSSRREPRTARRTARIIFLRCPPATERGTSWPVPDASPDPSADPS